MSIRTGLCLVIVASLSLCTTAFADRLLLSNGKVLEGKLLKRDATGVEFRVVAEEGKMTYVRHYAASDIEKIEEGDQTSESEPAGGDKAESKAAAPSPTAAVSGSKIEDKPGFLRAALKKAKDGKIDAAVTDLNRLVRTSTPEELTELSDECKKQGGLPLDEWLSSNRLQAAMKKFSGQWRRLEVSPYEQKAMIVELQKTIEEQRGERVGRTSIDQEIDEPKNYKGSAKDAKEFTKHIALVLGLVSDLERFQPAGSKGKPPVKARTEKKSPPVDKDKEKGKEKEKDGPGADEQTDARGEKQDKKSDMDVPTFKKQLLELQKVVKQVAFGGSSGKSTRMGDKEGSADDEEDADGNRPRQRRGPDADDNVRRGEQGAPGDEEADQQGPPRRGPMNQANRVRRPPPPDQDGGDEGQNNR